MTIAIPDLCLVVLMGPSGAGKSTFARAHFLPTEILSSDRCRGLLSDDENNQAVTPQAFELLHHLLAQRLLLGKVAVIDATHVWPEDRRRYVALAKEHGYPLVAIAFDLPPDLCHQRNQGRPDRTLGPEVVWSQSTALRQSLGGLAEEGFGHVTVFTTPEEAEAAVVERTPALNDPGAITWLDS